MGLWEEFINHWTPWGIEADFREGIVASSVDKLAQLADTLLSMSEIVLNFILLLPQILLYMLDIFIEILGHPFELFIFCEIIILSFALIKFSNNELEGKGYNRIIQMFGNIINYHADILRMIILIFKNIYNIIFKLIESISP